MAYDMKFQAGSYTVEVDTQDLRGYFEHDVVGDESAGGLWFEKTEDGTLTLTDYDGVFELPMAVITGLRSRGLHVDKDFE